jgi:hypothetical protein
MQESIAPEMVSFKLTHYPFFSADDDDPTLQGYDSKWKCGAKPIGFRSTGEINSCDCLGLSGHARMLQRPSLDW